jgi:hypothetical protein
MTDRINVGDLLRDNDPRTPRTLTITSIGERYVWAVYAARTSRIRMDRIYIDSKPRRTGFTLWPKEGGTP